MDALQTAPPHQKTVLETWVGRILIVVVLTPFVLLGLIATVPGFAGLKPSTTPAPSAPAAAPDSGLAIVVAEESVRGVLKDPDSARFSQEVVRNGALPIVCGVVSARNSFGGYGDPQSYIVVGSMATLRDGEDDKAFVSLFNSMCTDQPPRPRGLHAKLAHRHRIDRAPAPSTVMSGATAPS